MRKRSKIIKLLKKVLALALCVLCFGLVVSSISSSDIFNGTSDNSSDVYYNINVTLENATSYAGNVKTIRAGENERVTLRFEANEGYYFPFVSNTVEVKGATVYSSKVEGDAAEVVIGNATGDVSIMVIPYVDEYSSSTPAEGQYRISYEYVNCIEDLGNPRVTNVDSPTRFAIRPNQGETFKNYKIEGSGFSYSLCFVEENYIIFNITDVTSDINIKITANYSDVEDPDLSSVPVKGIWNFNENISLINAFHSMQFRSNGVDYSNFEICDYSSVIQYGNHTVVYDGTWKNEAYRTVDFGEGASMPMFIFNWLIDNAVCVDDPASSNINISYDTVNCVGDSTNATSLSDGSDSFTCKFIANEGYAFETVGIKVEGGTWEITGKGDNYIIFTIKDITGDVHVKCEAMALPKQRTVYAGTYQFADTVTETYSGTQALNFDYYVSPLEEYTSRTGIKIVPYTSEEPFAIYYEKDGDFVLAYRYDGWDLEDYKTITILEDQTVSEEFYNWFVSNTNLLASE